MSHFYLYPKKLIALASLALPLAFSQFASANGQYTFNLTYDDNFAQCSKDTGTINAVILFPFYESDPVNDTAIVECNNDTNPPLGGVGAAVILTPQTNNYSCSVPPDKNGSTNIVLLTKSNTRATVSYASPFIGHGVSKKFGSPEKKLGGDGWIAEGLLEDNPAGSNAIHLIPGTYNFDVSYTGDPGCVNGNGTTILKMTTPPPPVLVVANNADFVINNISYEKADGTAVNLTQNDLDKYQKLSLPALSAGSEICVAYSTGILWELYRSYYFKVNDSNSGYITFTGTTLNPSYTTSPNISFDKVVKNDRCIGTTQVTVYNGGAYVVDRVRYRRQNQGDAVTVSGNLAVAQSTPVNGLTAGDVVCVSLNTGILWRKFTSKYYKVTNNIGGQQIDMQGTTLNPSTTTTSGLLNYNTIIKDNCDNWPGY